MATPRGGFPRALKALYDYLDGTTGAGTIPAVTGLRKDEGGPTHGYRTTRVLLSGVVFPLVDAAGVVAYTGLKILDMPDGAIAVVGAHLDLTITKSSAGVIDAWDGDVALGTVTASNNATLTSTEANLVPSTPIPQAVAGAAAVKGVSTGTEAFKVIDGTGTAVDVYLNLLVDDTDHDVTTTPANLIVSGTVTLRWINLGDV